MAPEVDVLLALVSTAALAKPTLAGLSVAAPAGGLCPGERHQLVVTTTDDKERTERVRFGPRDGVTLTWELGAVTERGAVEMPADPRKAWGREGKLTVTSDADPKVVATAAFPLRYDCALVIDHSGAEGGPGEPGADGAGSSADEDRTPGDQTNALTVGSIHGTPGKRGEPGALASDVTVRVSLATEPRTGAEVLQVGVRVGDSPESFAAISADGGKLVIRANGGAGGPGGAGGDGGSTTGRSADGGTGGDGGPGGAIRMVVDPSADGRAGAIVLENAGGLGGSGGPSGSRSDGSLARGPDARAGEDGQPGTAGPPPDIQIGEVGALW